MDKLQRKFEAINGYELDSRIDKILPELGFAARR
jgi:ATP-binding cassette subfamily F protein 3